MVTIDVAAKLALALPEVTEGTGYGHRKWFVNGKGFAWERPFSKADIRRFGDEPVPDGPILAVLVDDLGERAAAIAEHPDVFFTIEHLAGYPAFLIQLNKATRAIVKDALIDGWLSCAPTKLADEFLKR